MIQTKINLRNEKEECTKKIQNKQTTSVQFGLPWLLYKMRS